MVEVKLEALDFSNAAADTYVAVRIGDNQKLSRLSAARNFKFPQSAVGDRKFGKIDVFKRVGSASIGIRHEEGMTLQELDVPCTGGSNMNFRVTLAGGEPAPTDKVAAKNLNPALDNAKSYLLEHNLEMMLSDAMQAVLREKPANPTQFLAERLLRNEGTHRRVQTAPGGARTRSSPESALDTDELRRQAKQTLVEATSNGKLDSALSQVKASKSNGAGLVDTEALRQQAKQTLLDATSSGKLDAALSRVADSKKTQQDGDVNTEALRQQAKQTLLDATSNGQLDAALSRVKESKTQGASDADALRMQAKQTLLEATANGKLDAALGRLKDTKTDAPASDYEALRLQAKQTLLEATSNGKLDKALGRLSESKGQGGGEDTEALRKQAKQTLLAATESGKLDTALTKLKDSKAAPDATENKPPEVNKLSIPGAQDLPAHMKPSASPRMPSKMRTAS